MGGGGGVGVAYVRNRNVHIKNNAKYTGVNYMPLGK